MHILNLSKRNGRAQERMLAAGKALATAARIEPALIEALTPKSKEPAVRMMQQREAIADLLEALAIAAGIPLTEAADEEAPAEEPAAESVTPVTAESSQETVSLPDVESGEALPPPVDEDPRAVGGVVDGGPYLVTEPDSHEIFVPTVDEEAPAEEPAAEDKPKGKRSASKKK